MPCDTAYSRSPAASRAAYLRVTRSQFSTCDCRLVTTVSIPLPQLISLFPFTSTIRSWSVPASRRSEPGPPFTESSPASPWTMSAPGLPGADRRHGCLPGGLVQRRSRFCRRLEASRRRAGRRPSLGQPVRTDNPLAHAHRSRRPPGPPRRRSRPSVPLSESPPPWPCRACPLGSRPFGLHPCGYSLGGIVVTAA